MLAMWWCVLATLLRLAIPAKALWPEPSNITRGTQIVRLSATFSIEPPPGISCPDDLRAAIVTARQHVRADNLYPLSLHKEDLEAAAARTALELSALKLRRSGHHEQARGNDAENSATFESILEHINKPIGDRDESYTLHIPTSGEAELTANTSLGFLRGLQTFTQLVYSTREGAQYLMEAPYDIQDRPAYPVRGFLLDTSRNFYPLQDLRRTLQAASWAKMNYFQWHITDSHAWPLVINELPKLSEYGSYSHREQYTPNDVTRLIRFANSIGIEVALEIDTPGHTNAIAAAYPGYVACSEADWTVYAVEPPAGQLRLNDEAATNLILAIYKSVLAYLPGRLFVTGGDEVNLRCYSESEEAAPHSLFAKQPPIRESIARFVNATHALVLREKKTPIVWEDLAIGDNNVPLHASTIVIAWRGPETFQKVLAAGFRTIQTSYQYFYLDCGRGSWVGPGESWCPYSSWWKIYSFGMDLNVSEVHRPLLLGGQVALWSEQADGNVIDGLLWPRAAAAAELWWLGSRGSNGNGLHANEALPRLHDFRYRMVNRGIKAMPLQPHWCALRPGKCSI